MRVSSDFLKFRAEVADQVGAGPLVANAAAVWRLRDVAGSVAFSDGLADGFEKGFTD
jgi:hypothetical protein